MISKIKESYFTRRSRKLLAAGKAEKALRILLRCIDLNPSAENRFNLALSYMALYQYDLAEQHLLQVKETHPDNEINLLALIEAFLMQRKWSRLEDLITKSRDSFSGSSSFNKYAALALDPVEREKYVTAKEKYNSGMQEIDRGNKAEALNLLRSALDYFNESSDLLRNIGLLHLELSEYEAAYRCFNDALSRNTGDVALQKLLIRAKRKLQRV